MAARKRSVASASAPSSATQNGEGIAATKRNGSSNNTVNKTGQGAAAKKKNEDDKPHITRTSSGLQDELSLIKLIPAIIVSSLVSVGSYYSCDSIELAEDALVATVRTILQLSLLAAMLSPLFRFVENQTDNNASSASIEGKASKKHISKGFWNKMKEQTRSILMRYSAPFLVFAYVFCFMLPLAAYEASSRAKLTLRPATTNHTSPPYINNNIVFLIVMLSLFTAVSAMGAVAVFAIVKPVPRYSPRHVIPLCGMLFNNALSAISLALDLLFGELQSKQRETIELMISFGASPWAATRHSFRAVLASSLKPQINSMNVIGLVAIPGMMTGQVLGGASPTRAARYQMIIMCLILGACFISVGMTAELVIWNAFDSRGALRDDWIVDNQSLRVSQLISSLLVLSNAQAGWGRREESRSPLQDSDRAVSSVIAVELSTEDQKVDKQPGGTSPLLQVSINGSFAKGNRIMTANLTIPASGDIVILQGPSGIGKSILLKTIAQLNSGLIPSSATAVPISLSGRDRDLFHPSEWRQSVLYLPQHGASMLQGTPDSFLRFIASSTSHKHISQPPTLESLTSQTTSYIEAWGVHPSKLAQPWAKLSGGESQRVLLAIALATRPKILLADECTSALDLESKLKVEESLKNSADEGCAMVLVTHDDAQARRLGTVWMSMNEVPLSS